ncbi:DegT/DnrJ/EryC1/StrS family aminotransferase [Microbacterium sp. HA-8]|uniref:DegT/DnrJ/EryC1/StrS family aminotransferase n=1 Tax=Microbacterium sp. HA-8 TaxID=3234200 RepID=UPI0038F67A55
MPRPPRTDAVIPISVVRLDRRVEERVLQVIRSGVIAQGPMVAEFEERFSELADVSHAIAVNNGTTALVAAMQAHGLGPGDEVITSPFTFAATLNAILETGASVRFSDIRVEDFGLDAKSVNVRTTAATRAVVPVHLYGQSVDLGPIVQICNDRGLALIEDAAQAHGATYGGKSVGSFGTGCFSFYATKNLTSGEGGVITTNDDELAARLRILRNQGMRARYEYVVAGHNYRMTDLQAAVVIPQIDEYPGQLSRRRAHAAGLTERLDDIPGLVLPKEMPGRTHVWHQYTVLLPENADREDFVGSLLGSGVTAGVYYPRLVHEYEPYQRDARVVVEPTPVASDVSRRCVSLPVHPYLTDDDLDVIAGAVKKALKS